MTRKTKDYILIGAIAFLCVCLAASGFMLIKNNKALKNANSQIKENQTTIESQAEEKKQLEDKLKQSEESKAAIQSELDSTKQAKESLEKENSQLKAEITQLRAKKQAAVNNLINNTSAVVQNPQPTGKICYLTFDDGPSDNTLKILEILARYNAKATFFVTNTPQSKTEYIPQIHAAGHTVGLHTNTHIYSQVYSSVDNYFADLNAISNKVKELTGVESKVIRFPGGSSNGVSRKYCPGIMTALTRKVTEMGYTYFDWNVSSQDASAAVVSSSKIANSVLQGAKNKTSICVLMHDAPGKTTTVTALPTIIEGLIAQGYSLQPLTKECHGYHHSTLNN